MKLWLAVRSALVSLFHLFWSPVTNEKEVEEHDMTANQKAVFVVVSIALIVCRLAMLKGY